MTKIQFIILSTLSAVLVILLGANFLLLRSVQKSEAEFNAARSEILQARQSNMILRQMATVTAQAADKEPALAELLRKYRLTVTLTIDGKQKTIP